MSLKRLFNAQGVARSTLPLLPFEHWRALVSTAPERRQRVVAMFGTPASAPAEVELVVVLAHDEESALLVARTALEGDSYRALTPECPELHLFEREIAEQWGVEPLGHPWLKPVRFVRSRRPGHEVFKEPRIGVTDFYRVEGEEIHEVGVGPIHAGVIEPGHFRFQCHGEQVFHLEVSLGYQHRGVERAMLGGPNKRSVHYMETVAGDTTIGHTTAYCQALEALSGTRVSARAHALRGIALELERLANHTGGLGALANDVGFLPTASFCGRLRGDFLNLSALLCGSRFGRGFVRPGGVGFDVDAALAREALARLERAYLDVESAVNLLWSTASVQSRFEDTGRVPEEVARQLGMVGVVARACGIERDVRHDHPAGIFQFAQIPLSTWHSGDVFARAHVRWLEIQRSVAFVRDRLKSLPVGPARVEPRPLQPDRFVVSLVEGWRGEVCHVVATDAEGRFAGYKVVDASFHNWHGMQVALRDEQISDFPLCNKSFDMSYCGFDL
jgi:Ni,Fe-hydrogenase III large subunit